MSPLVGAGFGCLAPLSIYQLVLFTFAQDTSYEFEKHRHVPVKYRRDLWDKTGALRGGGGGG